MIIYFNTGESFKYLNAITVNQETFEGESRPSIEVTFDSKTACDANTLKQILDKQTSFTLIGDDPYAPEVECTDYTIFGNITVTGNYLKFKMFKKSSAEIQLEQAISAVDSLLLSMEDTNNVE